MPQVSEPLAAGFRHFGRFAERVSPVTIPFLLNAFWTANELTLHPQTTHRFYSYHPPRVMASAGRRTHYEPPWGNASIIGVAGSSGSGKTSLAMAIVASLNLPWVVILSMVGFHIGKMVTCPSTNHQPISRTRSISLLHQSNQPRLSGTNMTSIPPRLSTLIVCICVYLSEHLSNNLCSPSRSAQGHQERVNML
jgi:hypothetical protein